jgi:hypothetical protein
MSGHTHQGGQDLTEQKKSGSGPFDPQNLHYKKIPESPNFFIDIKPGGYYN